MAKGRQTHTSNEEWGLKVAHRETKGQRTSERANERMKRARGLEKERSPTKFDEQDRSLDRRATEATSTRRGWQRGSGKRDPGQ